MTRAKLLWLPTALVVAALTALASPSAAFAKAGLAPNVGNDVSYAQCSSSLPQAGSFGIVGATAGIAWSSNSCLSFEYAWASGRAGAPGFYMNTANPGPASTHWNLGGPRACLNPSSASDPGCAYDYGWNAAAYAFSVAAAATGAATAAGHGWFADVEIANSWDGDYAANAADVEGGLDYLLAQGVPSVGVYSTAYQWGQITGGAALPSTVGDWLAGARSQTQAAAWCSPSQSFSGGPVRLVQFPSAGFDSDWRC